MALFLGLSLFLFWLAFKSMFEMGYPPERCIPTTSGGNICFQFSSLVLLGFIALSIMVYFMSKLENRKR
ncbi:hypothetical protein [uncultured Arcticibacterium sp.]|uniref:hypothetical protein n=1 Tax=uncultured Arcticibacterium sp. TaxID=2173042 RepID=UPI0030F7BE0B